METIKNYNSIKYYKKYNINKQQNLCNKYLNCIFFSNICGEQILIWYCNCCCVAINFIQTSLLRHISK